MRNHLKEARSTIAIVASGLLMACFGLLWSSSAHAQGDVGACSNRTLKGDYATVIEGQILGPNLILRGLNMSHFDGEGNSTGVDFVTLNGIPEGNDWRPLTGTYEISPDCTGEATINGESDGPPLQLKLVVADHGRIVHSVVIGNPVISTGTRVN